MRDPLVLVRLDPGERDGEFAATPPPAFFAVHLHLPLAHAIWPMSVVIRKMS